jgi:hypothetical protein
MPPLVSAVRGRSVLRADPPAVPSVTSVPPAAYRTGRPDRWGPWMRHPTAGQVQGVVSHLGSAHQGGGVCRGSRGMRTSIPPPSLPPMIQSTPSLNICTPSEGALRVASGLTPLGSPYLPQPYLRVVSSPHRISVGLTGRTGSFELSGARRSRCSSVSLRLAWTRRRRTNPSGTVQNAHVTPPSWPLLILRGAPYSRSGFRDQSGHADEMCACPSWRSSRITTSCSLSDTPP